MACPSSSCNPAPSVGSWTFTANPSANRFCDDRLIGLAQGDASLGLNLTAVDPITGCLFRPAAPKGIYQHDPDGCQPDFIGPLDNPLFTAPDTLDTNKAHYLPVFESDCGGASFKLVRHPATAGNLGLPAMLREECCTGGTRYAMMIPEYLANGRQSIAGNCISPRVLGFVPYERVICDGRTVTEYRWYSMDRWQQSDAASVVDADVFDAGDSETQNLWLTAWRDEGCATGVTKVKQLVKLGPAQAKSIFGIGGSSVVMLETPLSIYFQHKSVSSSPAIVYYPALGPAGALPIVSEPFTYNLSTNPIWDTDFKQVIVTVKLKGTTLTELFDGVIVIGGREYARVSLPGDNAGGNDGGQYILPIPSSPILTGNFYYQINTAGSAGSIVAQVFVDGFIK